jgi:MFS transporter, DHA2 family, multidrug resistance protein
MTIAATTPKAGRKEWIGLAVLALPCLLYSMDLTVLHLAIPKLSADLQPTSAQLLWIIDIYGFLVAGSLITMGTLGDRIGRRRLLLAGAAFFGAASVLAAFSTSAEMLIATRALLGLAGATIAPSTMSLLRNMFLNDRQRTTAIAVWITAYSIGGAIGPLIGGVLLEYFWWGSVFLISVPVMVLLLVLGPILLPEYRDPNAGRPDVLSTVLSLGAVLAATWGLKQIAQDGLGAVPVLSIAVGLALGLVFVRRQMSLADPLIDLALFKVRGFSASIATYGLSVIILFGGFLFLPQYMQLVLGMSPLEAGLWTLPWAVGFIVGSMATPMVAQRVRPAYLMAAGLLLASIGFAMFTQLEASSNVAVVVVGSVLFSLGFAPLFTLTNDLIIGTAPPERAGAASGLSETSAEFSGALGIAVFGSIGIALYRRAMVDAIPSDVPPEAADAARDTLGGALAAASQLPAEVGTRLMAVASDAFVQGLQLSAAISTVGVVALAIFIAVTLRHVQPSGYGEAADAPEAELEAVEAQPVA